MKRLISYIISVTLIINMFAGLSLNVFANENRKVTDIQMTFADLVQNRDGYIERDYDEDDSEHYYFRYSVSLYRPGNTLTVYYSDGTSESYTCILDDYGDEGYWYSDGNGNRLPRDIMYSLSVTSNQSPGNPWSLGKHTVTVRYRDDYNDDYSFDSYATVKIVENPIASVDFDFNYKFTEGIDGYMDYDEYDNPYFDYNISAFKPGNTITFNYRDGHQKVYTCRYKDYDDGEKELVFMNDKGEVLVNSYTAEDNESLYCEDSFYGKQLSCGEHNVSVRVNLLGYKDVITASFTVLPNPVESIEFMPGEPVVFKEYFGGRFSKDYNDTEYYYYNDFETLEEYVYKNGSKLTLNYTDSTSKEYIYNGKTKKFETAGGEELTYDIYCYANQEKKHWVKGENNSFTVRCCGRETEVPVEITDNGLERIEYHQAGEREIIVSNGQVFKNETWDNLNEDTVEFFFSDGTSMLFAFDEGNSRSEFVCGRESVDPSRILNDDIDFSSLPIGEEYSFKYSYIGVPVTGATCTVKAPDISNVELIPQDSKIFKNRNKKHKYQSIEHRKGNILRVTFTGGNVKEYVCGKDGKFTAGDGSTINERAFSYGTTQEGTWDTGIHQMYVSYYGITAYYDVEIREKEDINHGEIELNRFITVNFGKTDWSHSYNFTPSKSGNYDFLVYNDYGRCTLTGTLYLDGEKLIEENDDGFKFTYYCEEGKTYLFVLKSTYENKCWFEFKVRETSHVHSYTETVTPATCTKGGYTTYTCECGDIYFDNYTQATGHTVIIVDAAVPATFKSAGKTEGSHCAICGAVTVKQETVAKLGAAKLSKVKKGKKSFTAAWKKVNGVDGYQIQYSASKKFKKKKTVTVKGANTVKKTVKKLKGKKTYYVRIRAYKKINGKKQYSIWSKAKKVTTG